MFKTKTYIMCVASGILLWLGWAPHSYTAPLLWTALVPLLFKVEQHIRTSDKRAGKKIFGWAFLTNLIWNISCVYWIYHSIAAYNEASTAFFISLIPFTLMPLLMSIPYWILYQFRKSGWHIWAYTAWISSWLLLEYLQQSWQLAFPWMNLGNGMAQLHQILQWYEFTGVYGGTLWVLLLNIAILHCLLIPAHKNWRIGATLTLIIVPIGLSIYLYKSYEETNNPAQVAVVQPNIDPYGKISGDISPQQQIEILTHLSDSVGKTNTEYFIWPETAISDYVNEDKILSNAQFPIIQNFLYKYKNANLISGLNGFRSYYHEQDSPTATLNPNDQLYYDSFNSAIQLDNNPNLQIYHKSKLVPGVERMPFANHLDFLKPYLAHFGGSIGGFGYQNAPSVFYSGSGIAVAPVICYESIWGDWVADAVNKGAQFIAVITNDGWWGNTSGKDQHALYAKLRAIENRRWVARAANTGISGFINARGDVIQQSNWWTRTALHQEINLNTEKTFYSEYKDWLINLAWIAALACFFVWISQLLKRKTQH